MLPKTHIILGIIFSILIYFIFKVSLFDITLIFLASVFIDFDHYIWYFYEKKSLNLKHAYYWFIENRKKWLMLSKKQRGDYKRVYLIFHSIEFWIFLLILSFINRIFLLILVGVLFHMIFDYIEIINKRERFYPKLSLVLTYLNNSKRKKNFF